jgi:hypothetical protein
MSTDDRRPERPRRGGADREPTGWQPSVGAAREPIGRDLASRRKGTPPRRTRDDSGPPRPDLPADEQPQLPRGIVKEIDRAIGNPTRSRDIALALSIGSAAIDEERPDVAVEVLAWAKAEAPRISAIREAYGIALYHLDDFAAALTELQAYRRLTGRTDQNHVIADCFRGLGRSVDQVAEVAEALVRDDTAPIDRRTEAAIVWAAAVADQGDPSGGRAVLRRFLDRNDVGEGEHALRLRYLLADLAERVGDRNEARKGFASIAAVDPDRFDVAQRLAAIDEG